MGIVPLYWVAVEEFKLSRHSYGCIGHSRLSFLVISYFKFLHHSPVQCEHSKDATNQGSPMQPRVATLPETW